jgi:hypothetical protein
VAADTTAHDAHHVAPRGKRGYALPSAAELSALASRDRATAEAMLSMRSLPPLSPKSATAYDAIKEEFDLLSDKGRSARAVAAVAAAVAAADADAAVAKEADAEAIAAEVVAAEPREPKDANGEPTPILVKNENGVEGGIPAASEAMDALPSMAADAIPAHALNGHHVETPAVLHSGPLAKQSVETGPSLGLAQVPVQLPLYSAAGVGDGRDS